MAYILEETGAPSRAFLCTTDALLALLSVTHNDAAKDGHEAILRKCVEWPDKRPSQVFGTVHKDGPSWVVHWNGF